jgi:DNA-binding transcriptional LysR family regulator
VEPEGRGLRLTPAGHAFKQHTAPLLEQWLSIGTKLKGAQNPTPKRIGSFEVFTTYFLGHLMKFQSLEGLEIHELEPGKMESAIADEVVDLGVTYVPIPKSGVEFIEASRIKMATFGSAQAFRGETFSDLPFVIPLLPAEGTPSKVVGLDGWPDHRYPRRVKYRVTMMESAMELCRRGHAVAYLPEFVASLYNEIARPEFRLTELDCPIPKKDRLQSVYLIRKQGAEESPLERQIAKALRALK